MKALLATVATFALLGGTATAQAAPPPSPSFSFGLNLGTPQPSPAPDDNSDCLSTRQIIRSVRADGYSQIQVVDESSDDITVDARRGYRMYELTLDGCTGDILDRTRLR